MNIFDDIAKLQQIYLTQEVSKILATRSITDISISEKMIQICKKVFDCDEFIKLVIEQLQISISENLLASLYDTIRQKLPRAPQIREENRVKKQTYDEKESPKGDMQVQKEDSNQQGKQEHEEQIKSFPGLAIPDKDEIQLDLNLGEKIQEKEQHQTLKKQIKKEIKKGYHDQKEERSRSRQSRRRFKEKQSKHKKEKKHKRQRSYSSEIQHKKKKKRSYSAQRKKKRSYSQEKKKKKRNDRSHSKEKKKKHIQIKQLENDGVYKGKVTRVTTSGCFVHMFNVNNTKPAIIHSSQIKNQNVEEVTKVVKEGMFVWVKVLEILNDRVRLSMKDVNQYNGKQFNKRQNNKTNESLIDGDRDFGNLTGIKIQNEEEVEEEGEGSYNDIWEMSRMSYMGDRKSKKPNYKYKEDIEEVNIQVNDRQPPFLTGQTTKTGINLSPVRVIKNPEGTLQRQAMNAIQYAKQRRQIRQQQNKGQVKDLANILEEVTTTNPKNEPRKYFKESGLSLRHQKQSLPIFSYKDQLIQACLDNNIMIVIGQTGSGKTTQITQYLHEKGFSNRGKIGCTQPRRVAAMSVAKRVCEEMGVKLGDQVGYSIRFEDHTSSKTIIKYMTDGMLLRQALVDKYLSKYSVIMLDEAHERTINTDVLFGVLKKVVEKRKNDFLLIVTSATLEAKKFSSYFFNCKIFSIPGRTYNVQILYAKEPETDYLDASLMCVMQIHLDQPPGDILLFLTGQQEIDTSCQILNQRLKKFGSQIPQLIILPVYSALPSELQSRIFEPSPKGKRKIVIATNIAEASLTIDGIFYVVDPGFAKIKIYNSKLGMDTLVVAPISQASSKQRAGRAGRTGPGKCYRLYTEEAYRNEMLPTTVPEIQRANLANTVLELKAMGINDLINFDFMDAPPIQTLIVALQQLYYLSALDDEGLLTKLGKKMAEFPLEPTLSKLLLTSVDFGCTEEIVTIIAMLSVQNIFYRPKDKEAVADQKKTKFNHFEGDHLTYLEVYEAWKTSGFSASWSKDNFIQQRSLRRAEDVKKQILQLLQKYRFPIRSCHKNYSLIRKTIVSGFFFHAAKKDSKGGYRTLIDDHQVYIHPSSALFNKQPQWVIYHELVFTTKEYMRQVCTINPKWLIDVAPNFFKFTDEIGFTRMKRNEKLDPLDQRYGDPNAWRLSKRKG